MSAVQKQFSFSLMVASTALLFIPFAGCRSGSSDAETADAKGTENAAPNKPATGEGLFKGHCSNCHSVNGKGGSRAPDLGNIGGDGKHTADYLVDFIKDPKSKKPEARMPPSAGNMKDPELKLLADYLMTLKRTD